MKKYLIIILSFLTASLWAQYSPGLNWKSIETDHFDIIFDERIEDDAQSIANKLESRYDNISMNMGNEIDRYTLILPAEMIDSNGYVTSLDNKSVFYPVPPVDSFAGTLEWYDILSIHETRHMAQQTHIRNSFLQKILGIVFGSYGYYGAILIPSYFYEGDAVLTETLLSDSGRGRSPSFERGLRTILLNYKDYSFNKALHGSNKDYYPDYYVLGYYLMTYLRGASSADTVENIVTSSANNPLPLNFSVASLFKTKDTIPGIYDKVVRELTYLWDEQDSRVTPTVTNTLLGSYSKIYTNKTSPTKTRNGELFYIETGLDKVSTLHSDKGKYLEMYGNYSIHNNSVAYSKVNSDPRWLYKGYSDIYIYDLQSKKSRALTDKKRYFNPVYSNDGKTISVIEFSEQRIPSIVFMDSLSGNIANSIVFPKGDMITGLAWNDDDSEIAITSITGDGSYLGTIQLDSNTVEKLTSIDNIEKGEPVYYKDNILFVSSFSGIDNIHAINITTKEEFQVVSSRFGADYPDVVGDELIFSDYTVNGYEINNYKLDTSNWISTSYILRDHVDYFENLQVEELPLPEISTIEYTTKNYNPNSNLIDIHSWIVNPIYPLYLSDQMLDKTRVDQDNDEAYLFDIMELVLFSNDSLEFMDSVFFAHYSLSESIWDIGSTGTYRGWYPEVDWDFNIYSDQGFDSITSFNANVDLSIPLKSSDNIEIKSFVGGVFPQYYNNIADDNLNTLDLSYYLQYIYAEFGNPRRIFTYDFKAGAYLSFNQNVLGDNALSLLFMGDLIIPGFTSGQNLKIQNSLMYDILGAKNISQDEVRYAVMPTISVTTDNSLFVSFINIEYGVPLIYLDLSVFNFMYFTSLNIYVGYESFFTSEVEYDQIIKSKAALNYFFLRIPIELETQCTYYYDINDNKFNFSLLLLGLKAAI